MPPAVDACPGMLTLHAARDGAVARIRLPGGYVTGPQWSAISALASEFGDGNVDLTARGNVQLRGLRSDAAGQLAVRAGEVGLLPSETHDRARNITASPLAGLGRRPALRQLVTALDDAIVGDDALAALPGRFLFSLDDGTGGAALARSDVGLRWDGRAAELFIAGVSAGLALPAGDAVSAATAAARAAIGLGIGSSSARIGDLAGGGTAVTAAVGGTPGAAAPADSGRLPLGVGGSAGTGAAPREAVVCGARLGRLNGGQAAAAGSLLAPAEVLRLAVAGRIVIPLAGRPDDAVARLTGAGLLASDDDAMAGVSACSGLGCSRSLADVRALARPLPGRDRTHWAGCARGCGAPGDADLVVAAGPDSFLIGGQPACIAVAGAP